jgi:hypothetical protein
MHKKQQNLLQRMSILTQFAAPTVASASSRAVAGDSDARSVDRASLSMSITSVQFRDFFNQVRAVDVRVICSSTSSMCRVLRPCNVIVPDQCRLALATQGRTLLAPLRTPQPSFISSTPQRILPCCAMVGGTHCRFYVQNTGLSIVQQGFASGGLSRMICDEQSNGFVRRWQVKAEKLTTRLSNRLQVQRTALHCTALHTTLWLYRACVSSASTHPTDFCAPGQIPPVPIQTLHSGSRMRHYATTSIVM